jgi:hypothetical protein
LADTKTTDLQEEQYYLAVLYLICSLAVTGNADACSAPVQGMHMKLSSTEWILAIRERTQIHQETHSCIIRGNTSLENPKFRKQSSSVKGREEMLGEALH